jgi:uncharacterized damage-inducible protein DinB
MKIDDMKLLFAYNNWANQRVLEHAKNVSAESLYRPNSHSWGSLAGTLLHTVDAEYGWRMMLQHRQDVDVLTLDDHPDLDAIIAVYERETSAMAAYLESLTDEDLNTSGPYGSRPRVLWHCLVHVVNHGTQHRSECAVMLTELGHSPGDIDLTEYLNTLV